MDMALHGRAGYCTKQQSPNKPTAPQAPKARFTQKGDGAAAIRYGHSGPGMNLPLHKTRIAKRLAPDQAGAKKLTRRFGSALVCVRYRHDTELGLRYTTVELLVEQAQLPATRARNTLAYVHISHIDREVKAQALAEGATWDRTRQAWRMTLHAALRLGLHQSLLETHPPVDIKNGKF